MKNTIITILAVLVITLGGYLVYDKVNNKNEVDNKIVDNNNDKKQDSSVIEKNEDEYVGIALSRYASIKWYLSDKYDSDPDYIIRRIDLPKLLIDTTNAKKINEKIYNVYKDDIDNLNKETQSPYHFNIIYDYSIKDDILFLRIKRFAASSRSGGAATNNIYYYDIKNDKELTVNEVCDKFNITIDKVKAKDSTAESIYALMADNSSSLMFFNVYYNQNKTCPSFGCMDETVIK